MKLGTSSNTNNSRKQQHQTKGSHIRNNSNDHDTLNTYSTGSETDESLQSPPPSSSLGMAQPPPSSASSSAGRLVLPQRQQFENVFSNLHYENEKFEQQKQQQHRNHPPTTTTTKELRKKTSTAYSSNGRSSSNRPYQNNTSSTKTKRSQQKQKQQQDVHDRTAQKLGFLLQDIDSVEFSETFLPPKQRSVVGQQQQYHGELEENNEKIKKALFQLRQEHVVLHKDPVIMIQALVRGYLARRLTAYQSYLRNYLDYQKKAKDIAATKIQALGRGYLVRTNPPKPQYDWSAILAQEDCAEKCGPFFVNLWNSIFPCFPNNDNNNNNK